MLVNTVFIFLFVRSKKSNCPFENLQKGTGNTRYIFSKFTRCKIDQSKYQMKNVIFRIRVICCKHEKLQSDTELHLEFNIRKTSMQAVLVQ